MDSKNVTRKFILGILINGQTLMLSNHILITNNNEFEENSIQSYQIEFGDELHYSTGNLSIDIVFVDCSERRYYWQKHFYKYGSMSINTVEMYNSSDFIGETVDICKMLCDLATIKIKSLIAQNPYNKDIIK